MNFRASVLHPDAAAQRLPAGSVRHSFFRGFTLIEMLVVMAVIGILAGLTVAALPALQAKRVRSQTKAKLAELETAIENYKLQKGYYPPDNKTYVALPPLVYELSGTILGNGETYTATNAPFINNQPQTLTRGEINTAFGLGGFLNSSTEPLDVKNYVKGMKTSSIKSIRHPDNRSLQVQVFTLPFDGPYGDPNNPQAWQDIPNTWRYVSSSPTNNPGSFDLWAEVTLQGKTEVIGNWKN